MNNFFTQQEPIADKAELPQILMDTADLEALAKTEAAQVDPSDSDEDLEEGDLDNE